MELVSNDAPSGNKKLFVCPYHAWSYGTDGELMNVPFGEEGFGNCDAVHVENRNLIEVPTMEKAGMLWVVPAPKPGADTELMFNETFPDELAKEMSTYHLEKHYYTGVQTFRVDGNWKVMMDTYGEWYHVQALHKIIAPQIAGNAQHSTPAGFKPFGPKAGRMTAGKFTAQLMAEGRIDESRWKEPYVNYHLYHHYHVAPNNIYFIQPGNLIRSQIWPGRHIGECTVTFHFYTPNEPRASDLKNFKDLLDIVALEDMPQVPPMYANALSNPHAEYIFGRCEPCLIHEHRNLRASVRVDGKPQS